MKKVGFDKDKDFVHVKAFEINSNWLLNQILGNGKTNYQITKIDNDTLIKFLKVLDDGNLKMPDGRDSLVWLKDRVSNRYNEAQGNKGQEWFKTAERYRYILDQIDIVLMNTANKEEKLYNIQPQPIPVREPDLVPSFKRIENPKIQ